MKNTRELFFTLYFFTLLAWGGVEVFDIAWGTGEWVGELALTWVVIFGLYCAGSALTFFALMRVVWSKEGYETMQGWLVGLRTRLGRGRWVLALFVFAFPVILLQFSVLGVVIQGLGLRLILWSMQLFILVFLFSRQDEALNWNVFLYVVILTASLFSIFASMRMVTEYPFSLGWSEGNRLWDYSIMFGRKRYDYPADQGIPVYLDQGRQLVGGLPFLIPGLTIGMERAWVGLTSILPYILLGVAVFRHSFRDGYIWIAATLWTYLFLKQGPIHSPLVLCAVLVALAWRSRLWFSLPIIAFASYAARSSRITWMFAPIIWILQLWILDGPAGDPPGVLFSEKRKHLPAVLFTVLLGGVSVFMIIQYKFDGISSFLDAFLISPQFIRQTLSQQALLWYRLLPNATYGVGILVGLMAAVFPLGVVLGYLLKTRRWELKGWQRWAMLALPLLAFLIVGLVVSTKIGGGGDLHNMDMFLIAMFFVGVVGFYHGGREWLMESGSERLWVKVILVLMFAIPGLGPLREMRSYGYEEYGPWLVVLTDVSNERGLDMYPSEEVVAESLAVIQGEVDRAKEEGEVLFMDQRQLLTFGFIEDVPLVPDYDKKVLIEEAMTGNRVYFQEFYRDLEEHRFSLIIVQPLNTSIQENEYEFGEEGNAWLKWVGRPLLCFYEIKETIRDVNVQLLTPRSVPRDCAKTIP